MSYTNKTLTFENDQIYFYDTDVSPNKREVMMEWERSLMSASAAYATQNGGDILEIGFGMGISAGYIQSHSIDSHTIYENHPDIIPKALAWAEGKSNVTIVTGSWYDAFHTRYKSTNGTDWTNTFGTFDGLFMDTYGDINANKFSGSLKHMMKSGGVATWWNSITGSNNYYNIPDVTYDIINIDPPANSYFNHKQYYLPKKEF
jgi:predicted O-methyltransferase YrrM